VTDNKQTKNKTKKPQQNMLNQLMSHTQQAKKENKNKKASTEHAKSTYVTHNKQTKNKNKRASIEHAKSAYVSHNKKNKQKQKSLNRSC